MTRPRRVLLLGGTSEARQLADELRDAGVDTVLSLAGRTVSATEIDSRGSVSVRVGGFGGSTGLARFIDDHEITAMVCATHPFAAIMPYNADAACRATQTPLIRMLRPPWIPVPRDRWTEVPSLSFAPAALIALGSRKVLLTTGRQELAPFCQQDEIDFVVRSIDPADLTGFARATSILGRGPFTVDGEIQLMREHEIDTIVSKNSGGTATAAKLVAARRLGIHVVMVGRPDSPGTPTVSNVPAVLAWIAAQARSE